MLIKLRKYKLSRGNANGYIRTMSDTLVLIHVIFRHGDRTPEKTAICPTDPHKDCTYFPYGYGQLTNEGKRRAFRFGQSLRKRYGHFLDVLYTPGKVDAWTSDIDRTKMTLQLMLASLFPPEHELMWHKGIPWQPIPYHYTPMCEDKMILGFYCDKKALEAYKSYVEGPGQEVMQRYADVINYVEKNSGFPIDNPRQMFSLACTFYAQENIGMKLPEWTSEVWPEQMEEFAMKEFDFTAATKELQSLTIGKLLQKIIGDSLSKIKGTSECQIHLYSGHDFTVGMFLKLLNLFDGRHPGYCANVITELHNIDGIYGFKFKYQCHEEEEPKLLELPRYGHFWPIDDFIGEYKDLLTDATLQNNY